METHIKVIQILLSVYLECPRKDGTEGRKKRQVESNRSDKMKRGRMGGSEEGRKDGRKGWKDGRRKEGTKAMGAWEEVKNRRKERTGGKE